jgi:hypothetical protein
VLLCCSGWGIGYWFWSVDLGDGGERLSQALEGNSLWSLKIVAGGAEAGLYSVSFMWFTSSVILSGPQSVKQGHDYERIRNSSDGNRLKAGLFNVIDLLSKVSHSSNY